MRNQSQKSLAQLQDDAEKARRHAKQIERCAVLLVSVVGLILLSMLWMGFLQDQFANATEALSLGRAR